MSADAAADTNSPGPAVSVILPTYDRADFLPDAFAAIAGQTFRDWELIIVDDGSTDATPQVVEDFAAQSDRPVVSLRQDNSGAYAARAHGLRAARGGRIAFYDSDDVWLPDHLATLGGALNAHPDVGWAFSTSLHVVGSPLAVFDIPGERPVPEPLRPFAVPSGGGHRLDGAGLAATLILHDVNPGLQFSLIRREVFDQARLRPDLRNGGDRVFLAAAARAGVGLMHVAATTGLYRLHGNHSSLVEGTGGRVTAEKTARVYESLTTGFRDLLNEGGWTAEERAALRERLGNDLFWGLGYNGYWSLGRHAEALQVFREAVALRPRHLPFRKTLLACRIRGLLGLAPPREPVA
ncbi:glycosyltransferase family 2 protein [Alienimonas californiensis]|uniref:Glycosyltransferase EpsE n=1 Tax=Alienimonas californiensis TaxID=2527989 RepID=A0A517P468_9PLAN|nr:Putative glycosyltransferase EpsE [Alienimonas californiensis]